jgi:hypothetical protein
MMSSSSNLDNNDLAFLVSNFKLQTSNSNYPSAASIRHLASISNMRRNDRRLGTVASVNL